jgi:DNA-directed RNA polymerase specialized sigma24 family protein
MSTPRTTVADPRDLSTHAAWLRRLALALVQDSARAEDLVQETWEASLRHPPAGDRPVAPWLATPRPGGCRPGALTG